MDTSFYYFWSPKIEYPVPGQLPVVVRDAWLV